jgi:dihydrodipicolinate synthase/N-acetylneuraminate lyase
MDVAVGVINANAPKVDGVKVSLLDKQREIDMRRRLDKNVKMYTGDDFNYAELIAGDAQGYSHALLGIFDAIAPAASYALSRLAAGDQAGFHDVLGPTVPLSRHIFKAPTRFYKTGIVFMAIRIISRWWAGRKARVRRCISPNCFALRTRRGCSPIPSSRRNA